MPKRHIIPIHPVILVGGKSERFGRDKLLEPVSDTEVLIDRAIHAMHDCFAPPITLVGACDPRVAERADEVIPDRWPGFGALGGIATALARFAGDAIFVLSGDLPNIDEHTVRAILSAASMREDALAVMGMTERPEPLIALYRPGACALLEAAIRANSRVQIHDILCAENILGVQIGAEIARNANYPADLPPRCASSAGGAP